MRFILLFLIMFSAALEAEPGMARKNSSGAEPALRYLRAVGDFSPQDALTSTEWQGLGTNNPNFGYAAEGTHWFGFEISSDDIAPAEKIIEVGYPHLDYLSFYLFSEGRLVKRYETGDRVPFTQRPIAHPDFLFPVTLEPGDQFQVLLEVQTNGTVQVPIRVWNNLELFETALAGDYIYATYFGILIVTILFNLFIFMALREPVYLYYSLSAFSFLFLVGTLRGITYPLFWPQFPWLQNQAMLVSIPLALLFSAVFARAFLKLPRRNPSVNSLALVVVWASLLALAASFVLDYSTSIRFSVALAIPGCGLLLLAGPVEWWRGNRAARLYTLAWAVLTLGCIVTAMEKFGWLPTNSLTEYSIPVGSALEAIILTVALAQRLFHDREDRLEAQEARLREHAERRRAELKLMDQALHHPVTGLPNRACFEMLIKDLIQNHASRRFAIGIIQLLNYPTLHKTLGHNNSDVLILKAAKHFNRTLSEVTGIEAIERTEDSCFYLAALEMSAFAFVMDADIGDKSRDAVLQVFSRLQEPLFYLGMELSLSPATGLTVFPDQGTDVSNLIRQAYIAQENPGSPEHKLSYYLSGRDVYSARRLTMAAELKRALENDDLELYFQPKLRLADQQVVALEALIRWPGRDPAVNAETLIGVAEQTGLIKPLTRWVLEQAIRARTHLLSAGYEMDMSVNISPNNLREPDFVAFLQNLMRENPRDAGHIALELTETSVMEDPANSLRVLQALVDAGIPISIDDFGSGYSSLSYIKQLPANEIKIDKSLVTELCQQPDDRVIVRTTISMCHSLGYRVVAEGVEDAETMALLHRFGCDQIQGYVLTPPLPLDRFLDWLDHAGAAEEAQSG